jgi:p-hydroxybenzoate 3-monooxygenase
MRTQVVIVGAGPSGMLLAHLLAQGGLDTVVLENRSREYVESRIRAGIIEQGAVEVLTEAGLGDRLHREGFEHHGIYLQYPGERHHINFQELCGRSVWVYGQTEVQKDLNAARQAAGQVIFYEVSDVQIDDIETETPSVRFLDADGVAHRVQADAVAGCDGFHGVGRQAIPSAVQRVYERVYPFGWLGILADVEPSTDELIYAWHPNGFALHSMRSATVSRLYLQVDPADDLANWPDDRVWEELATRMAIDGWNLKSGPVTEKSILPMRSFVSSPMRHGRLFLAGDAAHIVPPTGAKGLNLAVADVRLLSNALIALIKDGRHGLADAYDGAALERIWRSTHFSWWMTSMLHRHGDEFDAQMQLSQLRYVCSSEAAAAGLAENYTGLPFAPQL